MITFFNTYIDKKAYKSIKDVLKTTFLSEGKLVSEFESKLSTSLGIINPIAVNSGTSALHLALDLAGIGEGDEVICPAQTFVATALAVMYLKARPVFCDIQYETGNIDPSRIESKITKKTKAILVVHWGGYPCDMEEINGIAHKHKLMVIEDAAHALGATYKGKPIGSISPITCFSFQAIKHVTTGDGGAVSCMNDKIARLGFAKRWFAIDRANSKPTLLGERSYDISSIGYKYHMNDYSAALGIANLENFKIRLRHRRKIANQYRKELSDLPGLTLFKYADNRQSAYWLFGFHVERRDDFIRSLKNKGIPTSVVHQRIDHNSIFGGMTKGLVNQESFDKTKINIPLHDGLSEKNVKHIINTIKKGW